MRSVRDRRAALFEGQGSPREERLRLLATASQVLASSFDLAEPLREVARLAVIGSPIWRSSISWTTRAIFNVRRPLSRTRSRNGRRPSPWGCTTSRSAARRQLGPPDPDRQAAAAARCWAGGGLAAKSLAAGPAHLDQGTARRPHARLDARGAAGSRRGSGARAGSGGADRDRDRTRAALQPGQGGGAGAGRHPGVRLARPQELAHEPVPERRDAAPERAAR